MSSFEEQLHSPKSYVMLGVIDGLINTKPYMSNYYYKQGYQLGIKEYQAGKSAKDRIDLVVKKQNKEFDKQMLSKGGKY